MITHFFECRKCQNDYGIQTLRGLDKLLEPCEACGEEWSMVLQHKRDVEPGSYWERDIIDKDTHKLTMKKILPGVVSVNVSRI